MKCNNNKPRKGKIDRDLAFCREEIFNNKSKKNGKRIKIRKNKG